MRIVCPFAVLTLLTLSVLGQVVPPRSIRALTGDGERILLLPDGTWTKVADTDGAPQWLRFGEIRTATLLSRATHKDFEKARFSFRLGLRDDPGLRLTWSPFDIEFDNSGKPDGFRVYFRETDRTRLKDLGSLAWSELTEVPNVPAYAERAQPEVAAMAGHIYVLHTKKADADFYALFRVETLNSRDYCTLSWIVVPSPEPTGSTSPTGARTYSGQPVVIDPNGRWRPDVPSVVGRTWRGLALQGSTLLSRRKHDDFEKASVDFTVYDTKSQRRNDRGILFGQGDEDAFMVLHGSPDLSRIKDLGHLSWSELPSAPSLPPYDEPTWGKWVEAVQGHIYQLRLKRQSLDLQVLFRVDWLEAGNTCVISWVMLPPDK